MASDRQIAANRRNGRLGGPKTDDGKQRSRLNSLKHGLTSSTLVVLPEEHQHEYDEVLRGFRESLQPVDSVEDALVLRLAQAHWRSLRARRIETGMLNTAAAVQRNAAREHVEDCPEHLDIHNAIGVAFLRMPPEQWQTYLRYDTTISRDFFRTLDTLTRLQRARQLKKPVPPPVPEPAPVLALAAGKLTAESCSLKAESCSLKAESCSPTAPSQLSDSGIRSVSQPAQQPAFIPVLGVPDSHSRFYPALSACIRSTQRHILLAGPSG
jgi:hypothetical protein